MEPGTQATVAPDDDVVGTVASCTEAHQRLVASLEDLTDEAVIGPSRLPGWTVGHVLTHLARNADSHVRMLEGALAGERLEQYEGGADERALRIETGARRHAATLVEDVVTSCAALEGAWAAMTPASWRGYGLSGGRPWPCAQMPMQRWREVEVHRVDLGLGYEMNDWSGSFVRTELLHLPTDHATRLLIGWIMGRAPAPDPAILRPWTSTD